MIDWFGVFTNALWIAGLAFLLALLSLARSARTQSTRQVLSQPMFRVATTGGLAAFALGMGLAAGSWFERIGWFIVVMLSLWEGVSVVRDSAQKENRR